MAWANKCPIFLFNWPNSIKVVESDSIIFFILILTEFGIRFEKKDFKVISFSISVMETSIAS